MTYKRKYHTFKMTLFVLTIFLSTSTFCNAQLKLAGIFGNNAIFQQGNNIPIWGYSNPNSLVKIYFAEKIYSTYADDIGKWNVKLEPMTAGNTSYKLVVKSDTCKVEYENIKVGEVWLASGQSNMEFQISNCVDSIKDEVNKNVNSNLRFFVVDQATSSKPLSDTMQKDWLTCSKENIDKISAVAYFFANELNKDKNIPVGIIVAARGGTDIETWISRDRLLTIPEFKDSLLKLNTDTSCWNKKVSKYLRTLSKIDSISKYSTIGINKRVHTLKYNDSSWDKSKFPFNMNDLNYSNFWGVVWLRKEFIVSKSFYKKHCQLHLPIKDKYDKIYLNGIKIEENIGNKTSKIISIPPNILKEGRNLLAIRIGVQWGSAGLGNDDPKCFLKSDKNNEIDLGGYWSHNNKIEQIVMLPERYFNAWNVNFNGMIDPIIPYGIKGILWYQGENNIRKVHNYVNLQLELMDDWRIRWGLGYLPFIYVQLPNYNNKSATPTDKDPWAIFRDAQREIFNQSYNSAMVCTIDVGESNNIHPKDKKTVGIRLYSAANFLAYGASKVYTGPVIKSVTKNGNNFILKFDFAENGLITKHNLPLKGFAVCNENGKWVWIQAKIIEKEILIEKPVEFKTLTKIQYGWQSNPDCNLYNLEGFPAVPFLFDL